MLATCGLPLVILISKHMLVDPNVLLSKNRVGGGVSFS